MLRDRAAAGETRRRSLRLLAVGRRARPRAARRGQRARRAPSCASALREAVASHIVSSPSADGATASATRCCARSSTTTCCPGERAELHLALARALERRAAAGAERRAGSRAGDRAPLPLGGRRPAARRWRRACAPPSAAERVHAYGEAAGAARARAGALGPRARRRGARRRRPRRRCSRAPPRAAPTPTTTGAPRRCCARRVAELDDGEPTPRRAGRVLERARAAPSGRSAAGEESRATPARAALALLPDGDRSAERARAARRSGVKFADAPGPLPRGRATAAREALEAAARRSGADDICAPVRSTGSASRCARSATSRRARAALREAIALARATGRPATSVVAASTSPTRCTSPAAAARRSRRRAGPRPSRRRRPRAARWLDAAARRDRVRPRRLGRRRGGTSRTRGRR